MFYETNPIAALRKHPQRRGKGQPRRLESPRKGISEDDLKGLGVRLKESTRSKPRRPRVIRPHTKRSERFAELEGAHWCIAD